MAILFGFPQLSGKASNARCCFLFTLVTGNFHELLPTNARCVDYSHVLSLLCFEDKITIVSIDKCCST